MAPQPPQSQEVLSAQAHPPRSPRGPSPSGPDRVGSRQREPGAAQAPTDTWPEPQLRSPCPQVRPCPSWAQRCQR